MSSRPSILIVEDSALALRATTTAIQAAGCRATPATHVAEACALLKTEVFDACLLDMILPDCVGISGYRQLRAIDQQLPIIIITGDPEYIELMRAYAPVLAKPITTEQLVSTVQAVIASANSSPATSATRR